MSSLEPGSPTSIYLLHTSNLSQPSFPVPRNRHPPNPRLLNCLHGSLRVSRERTLLRLVPTLTHCSPKPDCPRLSGSSSFQHFTASQRRLYGRSSRVYKVLPCRLTTELLALYPTFRRRRRCSSPPRGASNNLGWTVWFASDPSFAAPSILSPSIQLLQAASHALTQPTRLS